MTEKRTELVKNVMTYLGILLILVSATASRDLGLATLFLGLALLATQTFEFNGIDRKKLVAAEIVIASSLSIAAVIELVMSKSFGSPQVFMIVLLLGGILVTVETVRSFADL